MADQEKTTFGITVEPVSATESTLSQPPLHTQPSHLTETSSLPATPKEIEKELSNPFSAFYNHEAPSRPSMDTSSKQCSAANVNKNHHLSPYVHDLEAGSAGAISTTTTINMPKQSVDGRVRECTMWPSKQSLIDAEKERKKRKGGWWNAMCHMNKKQKMWFRVIVFLIIVAAAVGLGVGISRAVGGGVWAGNGQNKDIPN
jgi:hypothetical protein